MKLHPQRQLVTAGRLLLGAALSILLFSMAAAAQGPPEIFQNGVVNAASYRPPDFPGGRVAAASIISLFGRNLGPVGGVSAEGFPLPNQLGPNSVRVVVNDMMECRLFFASEGQINCQLPHDLSGDRVRLRVFSNEGRSEEIEIPLGPFGYGLFAVGSNGRGPLAAHNFVDDPDPQMRFQANGPAAAARRGQTVVLWGTGLGATDPPVQAGRPTLGQAQAVNRPEVYVGNVRARVQYAGRAPGFAGLGQIQIEVPDEAPFGCATPVRLQLRDQDGALHVGNVGTIAIGASPGPGAGPGQCQDPVQELISGLSRGSIVLGTGLGMLGRGQLGPMPAPGGPFGHEDMGPGGMGPGGMGPGGGPGPGAGQGFGGGDQPGEGGVGPNGIGPYGLHPAIPPHAGGFGPAAMQTPGGDVFTARFVRLAADGQLDIGVPPAATNSCNTYYQGPNGQADLFLGPAQLLDAGTLMLTGPGVSMTAAPDPGLTLYAAALPGPLTKGVYAVSGSGGADVGAFDAVELTVPDRLEVTTSLAAGTEISRSAGLTLQWTAGDPSGQTGERIVLIHGRSFHIPAAEERPVTDPIRFRSQSFLCSATFEQGEFAIPEEVFSSLPERSVGAERHPHPVD